MIEIPEATVLAKQLNAIAQGREIKSVVAGKSPHKYAWFFDEPKEYGSLFNNKTMGEALCYGGLVEITIEDAILLFGDGIRLRFHERGEKYPTKHQLLIEFQDSSALSATVQMYGGLWGFKKGAFDNPYYKKAKESPSPLSASFDRSYFDELISAPPSIKLSLKAFLATEQRIPGLGNGVLQDILYQAQIHPKERVKELDEKRRAMLFDSLKDTLERMASLGGRDTEKDLFNEPGGYLTKLSRKTHQQPCQLCDQNIQKSQYLGGAIYYCPGCQAF